MGEIALGCGNFGGVGSSPAFFGRGTDRDTAFALMDGACELGIAIFDTADAYGGGRSETWIGEWLRGRGADERARLRLQTKTFNPMAEGADSGLSPARIRRQLASSLTRLGVERVDVYFAHEFDPLVPVAETLGVLDELRREGLIGAAGASNFDAAQLAASLAAAEVLDAPGYAHLQNGFSLLEQGDRDDVLALCARAGVRYQAFGPLAGGWLSGKYRRGSEPPAGSRMTQRPQPYARYDDDRVWAALDVLRARADEAGSSMSVLALAWLLADPDVDVVVIGPNRVEHLADVPAARALRLSPADRAELTEVFRWES